MIFDHTSYNYQCRYLMLRKERHNGAYYYSKEIVENIIPRVKTDYNWVTINASGRCWGHSIVFIHNNKDLGKYQWLNHYRDLILVCGVEGTVAKCRDMFPEQRSIYLPLSVDVNAVKEYRVKEKTKDSAFVGRLCKRTRNLPEGIDCLGDMSREELLQSMAQYKNAYAVGRCAIEAKILGCEVLPYDERYPDPSIWKILDNRTAARILQKELDRLK